MSAEEREGDLAKGLRQSAAGEVVSLGNFAKYAKGMPLSERLWRRWARFMIRTERFLEQPWLRDKWRSNR
jgi:hypothetical protein